MKRILFELIHICISKKKSRQNTKKILLENRWNQYETFDYFLFECISFLININTHLNSFTTPGLRNRENTTTINCLSMFCFIEKKIT